MKPGGALIKADGSLCLSAAPLAFDDPNLAEQAKLTIIQLPAQAWCLNCAQTVEIQQRYDACPHCGTYQLQVTQGDEMRIKELEVE